MYGAIVQPLMALFRPHKSNKKKKNITVRDMFKGSRLDYILIYFDKLFPKLKLSVVEYACVSAPFVLHRTIASAQTHS